MLSGEALKSCLVQQPEPVAPDTLDQSHCVEPPQDSTGHLPACAYDDGQVCSGEHGLVAEEQRVIQVQHSGNAAQGVLVEQPIQAIDDGIERPSELVQDVDGKPRISGR